MTDLTNRLVSLVAALAVLSAVGVASAQLASRNRHTPAPAATCQDSASCPDPTVSPAPTGTTATAPTPTERGPSRPTVVPGTLIYTVIQKDRPIQVITVSRGARRVSTFGVARQTDEYVGVVSPDATMIATIASPNTAGLQPGDLVIIKAGGRRHTLVRDVRWGGGWWPTWTPDSRRIVVPYGSDGWGVVDVETGRVTPLRIASAGYFAWSSDSAYLAYAAKGGGQAEIAVARPDGAVVSRAAIYHHPDCQAYPTCPFAVQAVSSDGRFVATGHGNSDPSHSYGAHIVLDMRSGKPVALPTVRGKVNRIFFTSEGGTVLRASDGTSGTATFYLLGPDGMVTARIPESMSLDSADLRAYVP